MSDDIRPFTIAVSDDEIADLKDRLARTRWPEPEPVDDWSQGIPLSYTKELCEYWANDYDWRAFEATLNSYDNFVTNIDGLDIHFIHVRSPHEDAIPLVISHGWPGSIAEFMKVLDPLTNPTEHGGTADQAFHVVAPSLPGFGWSERPSEPGTKIEKIATMWNTLMVRLGYDSYVAQGGDWGAAITTQIGNQAINAAAIHTNMPIGFPTEESMADLTELEQRALAAMDHYEKWDSGYSKQQSTRPQTLGYGLTDSPAGQAAWVGEKMWAWIDHDGHPEDVLTRDEILHNISIYWFTQTAASSARLYWESFNDFASGTVDLPTGCSIFPKEIITSSQRWAEGRYTQIGYWNELDKGGHFAAWEQPDSFVAEMRACFPALLNR